MAATGRLAPQALEGIILHLGSFGEAHRLVEVLGAGSGRQTFVARHARSSKRRFAGVLTAFADVRLQVQHSAAPSGRLGTISEASLVDARASIRTSLNRINRATTLIACVRLLCPENQAAPEAFGLLRLALDYIAAGEVVRAAGAYPKLAQVAGIAPDFARCQQCQRRSLQSGGPGQRGQEGQGGQASQVGLVGSRLLCARCNKGRAFAPPEIYQALGGGRIRAAGVANAVEDVVVAWTSQACQKRILRMPQGPGESS